MVKFGSRNNSGNGVVPSYDNLAKQVKTIAADLEDLITNTIIGRKDFTKTAKLVTANVISLKNTYLSIIDALQTISMVSNGDGNKNNQITNKDIKKVKALLNIVQLMGTEKMSKSLVVVSKNVQLIGKSLTSLIKTLGGKNGKKSNEAIKNLSNIISLLKSIVIKSAGLVLLFLPASLVVIPGMILMSKFITFMAKIISGMNTITDSKTMKGLKTMSRTITSMTLSFMLLVGGMILVSKMLTANDVLTGTLLFIGFVGGIMSLILVLSSNKIHRSTRRASLLLMSISLSFVLFVSTFFVIAEVGGDPKIYSGILQFCLLVGISVGLFVLINAVKGKILLGSLVMAVMSASLLFFTIPYLAIMKLDTGDDAWMKILRFGAFITIIAGAMALMGLLSAPILLGSAVALVTSISLIMMTIPYLAIMKLDTGDDAWMKILRFGAFITGAIGLSAMAGALSLLVLPGAVSLTMIGVSIIGIANAYEKISRIDSSADTGFGYLKKMIKSSIGLMLLAGASSVLILPGAIIISKMAESLQKYANVCEALAKVDSSSVKNIDVINNAIGATAIAAMKLGIPGVGLMVRRGAKNIGTLGKALKSYIKAIKSLPEINVSADDVLGFMESITPVANIMRDSVKGLPKKEIRNISRLYGNIATAIKSISRAYNEISKVEGDPATLAVTISTLVGGAINAFAIAATDPAVQSALEESSSWTSNNTPASKQSIITRVIGLSRSIGNAISSLAKGVFDMAQLRVDVYNDKGKKTGTRQLTSEDFVLAGEGITKIITSTITALESIANNPSIAPLLNDSLFKKSTVMKVIDVSMKAGEAVGLIAKSVSEMENMSFTDADGKTVKVDPIKASVNIQTIVGGVVKAFDGVNLNDKTINTIKNASSSLNGIIESTNKIDLRKAEKLTDILSKIVEMGKGVTWNFDKLADIINGKLIDTLEQLKETFESMNDTIDNMNMNTPPSVDVRPATTPNGDALPKETNSIDNSNKPDVNALKDMLGGSIDEIKQTLQDLLDSSRTGGIGVYLKNPEDIRL